MSSARADGPLIDQVRPTFVEDLPLLNCGRHREVMMRWETLAEVVFAAGTKAEARLAVAEARLFCGGCPISDACQGRASSDRYTGLAGGHLFVDGRRRSRPTQPAGIVA